MDNRETLQSPVTSLSARKNRSIVKRGKKEGRGFFLGLLTTSGIIIVFLGLITFQGKEIMIFTFEKFVINKALVSLLPEEYNLEKAETIRKEVYDFYEAAAAEQISDVALFEVSSKIQVIIQDGQILEEEVLSLMALIRERRGG